jgi:hypothetical protein
LFNKEELNMNKIIIKPFKVTALAASGSWTSGAIDLAKLSNENRLSIQPIVSLLGVVTIDLLASNDGVNYVDTATDVIAGASVGGGPGTDGKYAPILITTAMLKYCRFFKIRVTETGGANTVTVELSLFVQ